MFKNEMLFEGVDMFLQEQLRDVLLQRIRTNMDCQVRYDYVCLSHTNGQILKTNIIITWLL